MHRLRTVVGLIFPVISVLIGARVMPACHFGARAAGVVVYVGATLPACVGVALAVRDPKQPLLLAPIGGVVLAVAALLSVHPATQAALVALALVALGAGLGGAIGLRVQRAGHFLPAAAMAAAADIVSVTSSFGPSHAIADSPRALSLLAVSFAVPGTVGVFAPALGVGDLVFSALGLGVARAHGLPYARAAFAGYVGVLLAGGLSMALAAPVPALPFIGAAMVAVVPGMRAVHRKDATATTIAVGLVAAALLWAVVRAKMARP